MPPRKKSIARKKPSQAIATTAEDDHESPAPEPELPADVKVNETEIVKSIPEEASNRDPKPTETVGVAFSSESMVQEVAVSENCTVKDVNETNNEVGEQDGRVDKEKEDSLDTENVDGVVSINDLKLETVSEIKFVHKETTDVQVEENNNPPVVKPDDNEKGQEIPEVISAQETEISKSPCNNNIPLIVEDNIMENLDDFEIDDDDDIEEDDAENEDQNPLSVEDSALDNKKDKEIEIYVGKLDKDTVEDDLVNVFQQFGELKSTRIVRNSTTNKSKGFAFIQFASIDNANRVLSEFKDGIEVKGKVVKVSASQHKVTLHLGNICKTWDKEKVLEQLKEYGIENYETINIPEDNKNSRKIRGFAFLEFKTHADAVAAFQRLQKPDAVFGREISAKVSFARKYTDENLSHVKQVHLEGVPKDWNEEKVKEIGSKYGEIVNIKLCQTRKKNIGFGFITFASSESVVTCVEGINNTAFEGDTKIIASIAKPQKGGEALNKNSERKSLGIKGVLNTKINNKDSSKNKIKANPAQKGSVGESSKEAEKKGDLNTQQPKRKRKLPNQQKLNTPDPKKTRSGREGQNSKKAGNNKRKNVTTNEGHQDRNARGKKPLKKQKGNMHARDNSNSRIPKNIRREHDDYSRYTDPYAPKYAASASNTYHLGPDSRRLKEMAPHAGYIEPTSAGQSRYVQPVARNPYSQHQTVYLEPASTSQSQLYSRYVDPQSRGGYIHTAALPQVQPYRGYHQSEILQVARDPYDPGLARVVRHDGRGAGVVAYAGGQPLPASSQVRNHTSYYQGGGSYSSQRTSYY